MKASTYYNPAFKFGKGQLHSYSPKHTVPFSMLTLGQTSHWTVARFWKNILPRKPFLGPREEASTLSFKAICKGYHLIEKGRLP